MQKSSKRQTLSEAVLDAIQLVKDYYESYGWKKRPNGKYHDAIVSIDSRKVINRYYQRSLNRGGICFRQGGRYFLDAASGANPYVEYSVNYRWHVCVDFSFQALEEARSILGSHGLYVMADVAALPFKDDLFEGVLSANTLVHIPESKQPKALHELCRVLRPVFPCVIIYHSSEDPLAAKLVHWFLAARRVVGTITGLRYLKRQFFKAKSDLKEIFNNACADHHVPPLHFQPLPLSWFHEQLKPMGLTPDIQVYRLISKGFSEVFIPDNALGEFFLSVVSSLEGAFAHFLVRFSHLATIIIRKQA